MTLLAFSAMKDEGPDVLEWVCYHRVIGFDALLVYTNDTTDGSDALLDALDALGLVHHRRHSTQGQDLPAQEAAAPLIMADPVYAAAEWAIWIDADEFVLPLAVPDVPALAAALRDARADALALPWKNFGNAGHVTPPDDLVIAAFDRTAAQPPRMERTYKCLFRTAAPIERLFIHRPVWSEEAGDGRGREIGDAVPGTGQVGHDGGLGGGPDGGTDGGLGGGRPGRMGPDSIGGSESGAGAPAAGATIPAAMMRHDAPADIPPDRPAHPRTAPSLPLHRLPLPSPPLHRLPASSLPAPSLPSAVSGMIPAAPVGPGERPGGLRFLGPDLHPLPPAFAFAIKDNGRPDELLPRALKGREGIARINHYPVKSLQQFLLKRTRRSGMGNVNRFADGYLNRFNHNDCTRSEIGRHIPAVRAMMAEALSHPPVRAAHDRAQALRQDRLAAVEAGVLAALAAEGAGHGRSGHDA